MSWYNKVVQDPEKNMGPFIDYYENELNNAKFDTYITGKVERSLSELPGITEHRFGQLQEIEAVLSYLNIQLRKIRSLKFKMFLEAYPRQLTSRDAEKYVDHEDDVIAAETLVNEVALLRNRWLGVLKGLESKSFNLGHLTRLKTAGMEDFSL